MDVSFSSYRDTTIEEMDDSDCEIINESLDASFLDLKNKTRPTKNIVIADSDSGSSDDSNTDEESFVIKPKKVGSSRPLLIDSDSDNEDSERCEENEYNMLSAATRLSIFGVKPIGVSLDDSEFIKSDDEATKSKQDENSDDSDVSVSDMAPNPYIDAYIPPDVKSIKTERFNESKMNLDTQDLANISSDMLNMSIVDEPDHNEKMEDDDVINLSTDDEQQDVVMTPKEKKKTPARKSLLQPSIKTFIQKDTTYPNGNVLYVSKQVYQTESKKLEDLRENLNKVQKLLQSMNLETLPDNGAKLGRRCEEIKMEIKKQAEKLSTLIVDSNYQVSADGVISWQQVEKGSDAVQPRMFGAQAMNTHIAQRLLTLDRLNALHSSLDSCPSVDTLSEPPRALLTELMAHQLYALAWLTWRETENPKGGILADDMGLGKTLTMISLILLAKEKNRDIDTEDEDNSEWTGKKNGKLHIGGTLVVCPASLLKQWQGEVETHCKRHILKVEIHHGAKRETKAHRLIKNDIVLTTYNIIQRDHEKEGVLMNIKWNRVILDEAHIVRNHKSLTAQAIFALKGSCRWCLTGTPVHNKDLDLFSLLKFLRCSPFDDIILWKKWIDNKSTGGQERLGIVMKTLLLRRTKQQLQEQNSLKSLPKKNMECIAVTLSKEEMHVYQKVLVFSKTLFAQFLHQRADKSNYMSSNNANEKYYRMHKKMLSLQGTKEVKSHEILVLLLRLRQICCHPGLIHAMLDNEYNDDNLNTSEPNVDEGIDILSDISKLILEDDIETIEENENPTVKYHLNPLPSGESNSKKDLSTVPKEEGITANNAIRKVLHVSNPVFNVKNTSAKIGAVMSCLKENVFIHKGDKAIIVSQWTGMLDIIRGELSTAGIICSTLSGKVPVLSRQDIVKEFNDPTSKIKVLLLSLCAGGVGLNLVGANHLLLTDLHWNPQLESQAQDRIYRVGQKKSVHIYKFVCKDTVESSIKIIQDKKLALAENLLTGVKMTQSSKLSIEDLKLMFNMQ